MSRVWCCAGSRFLVRHRRPFTFSSDSSHTARVRQQWQYSGFPATMSGHFNPPCCGRFPSLSGRSFSSSADDDEDDPSAEDPDWDPLLPDPDWASDVSSQLMAADSESLTGQRLFLIQPQLKRGRDRPEPAAQQRLLEEARALVNSLPGWSVSDAPLVLNVATFHKQSVLGSGQLNEAVKVARTAHVSGVLFNVARLTGEQRCYLEQRFGCPVWDRYAIVLAIFRRHAVSHEARLQVALAELPYLRTQLRSRGAYTPARSQALSAREQKLRSALARCARRGEMVRSCRRQSGVPVVGVVGYTNAGKTSLIAALSGSERARGRDRLFATLDVTAHRSARRESRHRGLQHVYLDTVGFMLQLPSPLLDGFRATLREVSCADVLLHVVDVSQPDWRQQQQHVHQTLAELGLPQQLLTDSRCLQVANKCDLLPTDSPEEDRAGLKDMQLVSATCGDGLQQLLMEVEVRLVDATGRQLAVVTAPTGGHVYGWVMRHGHLLEERTHRDDPQLTELTMVVSSGELAALRRCCPGAKVDLV